MNQIPRPVRLPPFPWGLAAPAGPQRAIPHVLGVLPAPWVLLMVGGPAEAALSALPAFDLQVPLRRLAPDWWMSLRLMLAAVAAAFLPAGLHA